MPDTQAGTPDPSRPPKKEGKGKQQGKEGKIRKPMDKPKPAGHPIRVPKGLSSTLDPPSMKQANDESKNKIVTNESLVSESAFAVDSGFTPTNREIGIPPIPYRMDAGC